MNGKQLKNSILQWAIQGKLVPQDPNDEPASVLLEKIRQEKERLIKEKKIKRDKNASIIYRGEDNSYYEKFADGKVVCIDEVSPFEIPNGWEWCRLGEISTYAQTKRKINASNADTQLWELDLEDIEKGGRLLNIKTVGERKAIGDKTVFNRGDILYSKLRPYLLKILVAPEGGICTPEIIPFTCYGNICKDYIVSFLKSPYVDDYINSATFGVKMPRVSTETMTSLLVPLPPLSEQFRIDTRIKELMPYIDEYGKAQDKLNKLNEELSNTIRKSILQEAIQGKLVPQIAVEGTAQELLEQIKIEKQKLVKEGKLKKSTLATSVIFRGDDNKYYENIGNNLVDITDDIPFEIPNNWVWTRIGYLFAHNNGKQLNKGNTAGTLMEYITTSNLYWDGFRLDHLKMMPFEESEIERCQAIKGDLLVCEGGDIGRSCIWDYDFPIMLQNHIHKLRPYIDVCTKFFFYIFYLYNVTGVIGGKGIGIQGFSAKALHNTLVPLPPLQEQQRIVAQIEKLFEQLK